MNGRPDCRIVFGVSKSRHQPPDRNRLVGRKHAAQYLPTAVIIDDAIDRLTRKRTTAENAVVTERKPVRNGERPI
ncbi:hypothetical protein C476_12281 [Natrinema limicola JCM 13563]|uniref:Uncharacterized protein n=1 Tax=Natrinema limicola JCM 13563 TaxID=1230457 RepID=M0C7J1_9EURY|nr:hypothetical protein C476_12281 [Natrinema limicola JCM 13563]